MYKIFIDGQAGTTGLQIQDRLQGRADIELLSIDDKLRKDLSAKKEIMTSADLVILCLPDDAAREIVTLIENEDVRILDASTAFRVAPGWIYGMPELQPGRRQMISEAKLVSNAGCYASGFLLAVAPLIAGHLLPTDSLLSVHAVSGYSGGGRSLIEKYQSQPANNQWHSRAYSLGLNHKHLPEMKQYAHLEKPPILAPSVGNYYQGMLVNIPLFKQQLAYSTSISNLQQAIAEYYENEPCIRVHPVNDESALEDGYLNPEANNHTNRVDIFVFGHDEQMLVTARLDNLGKGASGAAVQNLNIMLGVDELTGLEL